MSGAYITTGLHDSGEPLPPSGTAEFIGQDTKNSGTENLPKYATVKYVGGEDAILHRIIDIDVGENARNVSLYFLDRDDLKCQIILDVIDANTIQRIGNGTTKLLNNFTGGIYVTYRITGRVRFRITKFHYDHFGRILSNLGNGCSPKSVSMPLSLSTILILRYRQYP